MRTAKAIEALEALRQEAESGEVKGGGKHLTAWQGKVRGVIASSLGPADHLLKSFDEVRYSLGMWSTGTPKYEFDAARHRGIGHAVGIVDAAIYQLELLTGDDEAVEETSFDSELWAHVANLVADEDWTKVASQTAIFVESRLRKWAGDPKDKNGDSLYGHSLYATLLADESDFRIGRRAGERSGWRMLGMGFAQAIGNVDRHGIQNRHDARRYAIGVLGLGSLLLTQLRFEHAELISQAEQT
jgi:hypothetical protein